MPKKQKQHPGAAKSTGHSPSTTKGTGYNHHHKINKDDMDKVKIKRAKRTHKKITGKEKALAALGLGSSLLGGAWVVSQKPAQTQFVRTQNKDDQGGVTSKIKQTLKNIFGAKEAKALSMDEIQAEMASGDYTHQAEHIDY